MTTRRCRPRAPVRREPEPERSDPGGIGRRHRAHPSAPPQRLPRAHQRRTARFHGLPEPHDPRTRISRVGAPPGPRRPTPRGSWLRARPGRCTIVVRPLEAHASEAGAPPPPLGHGDHEPPLTHLTDDASRHLRQPAVTVRSNANGLVVDAQLGRPGPDALKPDAQVARCPVLGELEAETAERFDQLNARFLGARSSLRAGTRPPTHRARALLPPRDRARARARTGRPGSSPHVGSSAAARPNPAHDSCCPAAALG